jgi:hypothetical protein
VPKPETFDIESITLGEMLLVERAAGEDFLALAQSRTGQMMIVLFLRAYRQQGTAPEWTAIASQRPSALLSFGSPSQPD